MAHEFGFEERAREMAELSPIEIRRVNDNGWFFEAKWMDCFAREKTILSVLNAIVDCVESEGVRAVHRKAASGG